MPRKEKKQKGRLIHYHGYTYHSMLRKRQCVASVIVAIVSLMVFVAALYFASIQEWLAIIAAVAGIVFVFAFLVFLDSLDIPGL